MPKKLTTILWCYMAIVLAAQFTTSHLLAGNEPGSYGNYKVYYDAKNDLLTIEDLVNKIKLIKKYKREDGCVSKVQFLNDPANCYNNEKCLASLKKLWDKCNEDVDCTNRLQERGLLKFPPKTESVFIDAIGPVKDPVIWGEKLVDAGSTKADSDVCGDFRFTVAGSPGWDCDGLAANDRTVCSCIGYYVGPDAYPPQFDHCCDPNGCSPAPWK